jgi:chemotaxis protein CheD
METVLVMMAQLAVAQRGQRLKTTLGSCVGVFLHDGERGLSGLAHVMLPERLHDDQSLGKYADTAIPELLTQMERRGSRRGSMQAFLAGGANMFQASEDSRIATVGEKNLQAVRRVLAELAIPVRQEDTGGLQGRTVCFDGETGSLEVRTLQRIPWRQEAE